VVFYNLVKLRGIGWLVHVRRMGDLVKIIPDTPYFSYGTLKNLTINGHTLFCFWCRLAAPPVYW